MGHVVRGQSDPGSHPEARSQERARIAHELIVSLDEGPTEEGVEAAWEQELERRAGEIDSGAVKLEPWSKLRQELDGIVRGS